ncbi:hypothetical protein NE865_05267 [Phthorimaea operculella]|nr:hypothetical protein NE865_05267 [Phthorimaea operculella]
MRIKSEIRPYKDTETYNAGDIVSGVIKYDIQDAIAFSKITVSLKGNGYLIVKNKEQGDNVLTRRKRENYVDIDNIIYKNDNGEKIKGPYEKEFNFILPEQLPSTLKLSKKFRKKMVYCHIIYYIRIKFQEVGIMGREQKFQKNITVNSVVKPTLSTEPTVYGEQKVLSQFSWKRNVIKINAVIDKSVQMPDDKIKVDFEITNDTNFNIKGVLVKMIELYNFKPGRSKVTVAEDVKGTESRSIFIIHGSTENRTAEIIVPQFTNTIEYSNLISRQYFITFTLELPKPRDDIIFKIPVQIISNNPPPKYWEALQQSNDDLYESVRFYDDEVVLDSDDETTSL